VDATAEDVSARAHVEHAAEPGAMEARLDKPAPEPQYDVLDPARLRLFLDPSGRFRATVRDDRSFLDVNVVRCFPQSQPDRYWAITDESDRVIGVIADPTKLDRDSYETATKALARHYLQPIITAVHSIREEYGAVYFDVETDHGRRSFVAKGVRDSVEVGEDGEITVVDVDENCYRIPDWERLDYRSRQHLERLI